MYFLAKSDFCVVALSMLGSLAGISQKQERLAIFPAEQFVAKANVELKSGSLYKAGKFEQFSFSKVHFSFILKL